MKTSVRTVLPAYLIAGAALFVALGGPAYASTLITGANIKDGSVAGIDIQNGSLTYADVKDGSLTGTDLKNGSVGVGDLTSTAQAGLTTSACPAGQVLRWEAVPVDYNSVNSVEYSYRLARCWGTGTQVMGDGILQTGEQCDDGNLADGDGCDSTGAWEGTITLRTRLN
jgi:cysteine-rich repeat protein